VATLFVCFVFIAAYLVRSTQTPLPDAARGAARSREKTQTTQNVATLFVFFVFIAALPGPAIKNLEKHAISSQRN